MFVFRIRFITLKVDSTFFLDFLASKICLASYILSAARAARSQMKVLTKNLFFYCCRGLPVNNGFVILLFF